MVISKFMNKSFYERLFSGIILVIIALITIILGNDILLVTVGIVSLIGLYEMNRVFGIEKYATGILSYIAVIIYYAMLRFDMMTYVPFLIVALLIACMAIYVFEFPKCKTEQVMAAIFGTIYVAVMLSFVYLVRMGNNGASTIQFSNHHAPRPDPTRGPQGRRRPARVQPDKPVPIDVLCLPIQQRWQRMCLHRRDRKSVV